MKIILTRKRLENLIYFLRAVYSVLVSGPKKKEIKPKVIAVVQQAKLGDIICTTPVFRAIKDKYPNSKLIVFGNFVNKEVVALNSDIDEYLVFKNIGITIKELKARNVECLISIGPDFDAVVSGIVANVPLVIGSDVIGPSIQTRLYNILKRYFVRIPHKVGSYAPREYLRLLGPIDIHTSDTKKYVYYSDKAKQKVKNFLRGNNINEDDFVVAISPSAGNKVKEWSADRFAKVSDYIVGNSGAKTVVIGSGKDESEVKKMLESTKKPVINALNKFSIDELKAFFSFVGMFISVDTGPIYIAEALSVPTIDITGPIDENEQPPIGPYNLVVTPTDRVRPELFVTLARDYDYDEARRQSESISVEMVVGAFDKLYGKLKS